MMESHFLIKCNYCDIIGFKSERFVCLICRDYNLCGSCYHNGKSNRQHTKEHPMQCILTDSMKIIFYSGQDSTPENDNVPQSFTCPYCGEKGFVMSGLLEHAKEKHKNDDLKFTCPVCIRRCETLSLASHLSSVSHAGKAISKRSVQPPKPINSASSVGQSSKSSERSLSGFDLFPSSPVLPNRPIKQRRRSPSNKQSSIQDKSIKPGIKRVQTVEYKSLENNDVNNKRNSEQSQESKTKSVKNLLKKLEFYTNAIKKGPCDEEVNAHVDIFVEKLKSSKLLSKEFETMENSKKFPNKLYKKDPIDLITFGPHKPDYIFQEELDLMNTIILDEID